MIAATLYRYLLTYKQKNFLLYHVINNKLKEYLYWQYELTCVMNQRYRHKKTSHTTFTKLSIQKNLIQTKLK